jgi:universal stress protein A
MKFKRIVVPVDFSDNSMRALDFAADLAQPFGADPVAIFALEPMVNLMPDYGGAQTSAVAELLDQQRRTGQAELARMEQRYARRGIKLRTLMPFGRPSQAIVDTARGLKADLIVMATHGRSGVSRMLMGSVAERVVRTAACPVLTLHAGDARAARRRSTKATRVHDIASAARARKVRAGGRA